MHVNATDAACLVCHAGRGFVGGCGVDVGAVAQCADDPASPLACFSCAEGFFTEFATCSSCDGARRCVHATAHLLCPDGYVLDGGLCASASVENASLITRNSLVKCNDGNFVADGKCEACSPHCRSCTDTTACAICENATVTPQGACESDIHASRQSHSGVVSCEPEFLVSDGQCASCDAVFGAGCVDCDALGCARCSAGLVLENGACRKGDSCAQTDGAVCVVCSSDAVFFNGTDCASLSLQCVEYANGSCVSCADGSFLQNGKCESGDTCASSVNGRCLRCVAGFFLTDSGECQRRAAVD